MKNYEIKPIRNAIVMLTNQCNCRCVYCFEQRRSECMDFKMAQDTLSFIHRGATGHAGFTFFGGEPMLEFDSVIVPLVEWSKTLPLPTRFAMTTNGTLFSKDRLDFLKANDISFMLSMDGASSAQNKNRPLANGGNSFDAIEPYIPYILELWPNQSFRETLTEYNVRTLFEDIRYFSEFGCNNLMIVPDLFRPWADSDILTLFEQVRMYEDYLLSSFKSGVKPLVIHEYKIAFMQFFILSRNKGLPRRSSPGIRASYQCGFGMHGSVSIDPLGDIYGCHHISPMNRESEYYLGNIYDGVDEQRVRHLVERFDRQLVGSSMCKECGLDSICDGGCAPNNYQINGDEHKVPEMYCIWQRAIADSAYRLCKALADNEVFRSEFAGCARGSV